MAYSEDELISERRRVLQNPYAFIEQLSASKEESSTALPLISIDAVSASRKLLENPYAYLDGNGGYSAKTRPVRRDRSTRWSDDQIEAKVKDVHSRLWRERERLWSEGVPSDPIDLLDPAVALRDLGFDFEVVEGLGQMQGANSPIEVAGFIDTRSKIVRIGRQFPVAVRTFTAAHELGHAIMHPSLGAMHRDRPLDGSPMAADRIEMEANKFGSLFLLPAKLVRARFNAIFQAARFELSEETAFALAGCSLTELVGFDGTRRQLSRLLASAPRYNGRHFIALHQQFRVSREAMAIRLEELDLVPTDL